MVEYQRKMARGLVFTGLSVSAGTPIHRYLSTLHSSRNIINIGIKSYTSATSSNVASRQKHIFLLGQLVRLMPKQVKPLTEIAVKNLKPKQKPDGTLVKNMVLVGGCPNLYCCVKPSGSKSWLLRPLIGTRRPEIGLGTYRGGKATRKKKSTGEQSTFT